MTDISKIRSQLALQGQEHEEKEEVQLPAVHTKPCVHIAKILCNGVYGGHEELFRHIQDFYKASSESGDKNAAQIKVLRSILGLDMYRVAESDLTIKSVSDDIFAQYVHYSVMERSMYGINHNNSLFKSVAPESMDLEETLIDMALASSDNRINAVKIVKRDYIFQEHSYSEVSYYHELDEVLAQRDGKKLRIDDVNYLESSLEIADMLLGLYPILQDRQIRGQLSDAHELCYIAAASLIRGIIRDKNLRELSESVLSGMAPPRLKLITSLLYLAHDNMLRVGEIVSKSTEEGFYHEQ